MQGVWSVRAGTDGRESVKLEVEIKTCGEDGDVVEVTVTNAKTNVVSRRQLPLEIRTGESIAARASSIAGVLISRHFPAEPDELE